MRINIGVTVSVEYIGMIHAQRSSLINRSWPLATTDPVAQERDKNPILKAACWRPIPWLSVPIQQFVCQANDNTRFCAKFWHWPWQICAGKMLPWS
jgi:hypothetical protein